MHPTPSAERRVFRGAIVIVLGVAALLAPFLIGDWGLLFVFACLPMAVFLIGLGIFEIVRGVRQAQRESR